MSSSGGTEPDRKCGVTGGRRRGGGARQSAVRPRQGQRGSLGEDERH